MVSIKINGINLNIKKNTTVLQACNQLNIDIPKFCFQDNLEIAGNCRMCLVEIENSPKPVASCAMPVMEGMSVYTNTPLVKKARESVLEFLLINHPLDCPICDQGGECDLQDQTLYFGADRSRFFELKRSVEDKNCGPFIKTIMTRCIHCTRCVRFANEICGIDNLGTTGRGNHTEISFYLNNIFKSEFSANVIDLCPVGALTSKPFAFKARSWELKKKETVDILDGLGSNIIVQTCNNNIVRILPKNNKNINLEWISDKTRFFFDSIKYQRIDKPLFKENNSFKEISWEEAFIKINNEVIKTDPNNCQAKVGNLIDLKSLYSFKKLMSTLGINNIQYDSSKNNFAIDSDIMSNYVFNKTINYISKSDLCLLVFCDVRKESPLLNLKLRNAVTKNNLEVFSIGSKVDLTYPVKILGLQLNTLVSILKGKHSFCKQILKSNNFTIIIGSNIYNIKNSSIIINLLKKRFKKNVNILHNESGFLNFLEIFKNKKKFKINSKLNFLYNTDNNTIINKDSFNIYIGHHFTENAQNSNLLLPSSTFFEKKSYYLNIEGKFQKTMKILEKKNLTKKDSSIFSNLNIFLNRNNNSYKNFKFNDLFIYVNKNFVFKNEIHNNIMINLNNNIIKPLINNYLMTNILEKYSKILMNSLKKTNTYTSNNFTL